MSKQLYFAYGANLNLKHMREYCADMEQVEPYMLDGWELAFNKYADIRPNDDTGVYGALYYLSDADIAKLDKYENGYKKVNFNVTLKNGKTEKCMVYLMEEREKTAKPEEDYFQMIVQGYADWNLPPQHLFNAVARVSGGAYIPVSRPKPITS